MHKKSIKNITLDPKSHNLRQMTDEVFLIKVGESIAKYRKLKDLSQEKLAITLKINRSVLSRIEHGKVNCSIKMLRNIASHLNVSLVELLNVDPTL